MKRLSNIFSQLKKQEGGQAIVIVAAALIVLIGFTGLAIDLGFVWMRQAQLKSIVDSAALAGAPLLGPTSANGGLVGADEKAIQYLATNQIMDTDEIVPLDALRSFESSQALSALGAREYTITVTWQLDLFFMPVLGFDEWTLKESSTAAYFPLVDLYAGRRVALNGVTTSTQAVFGPRQQTSFGDAFSNPGSPFLQEKGVINADGDFSYVYRVEIPEDYQGNVSGPAGQEATNIVRIELLDPDSINANVPAGSTIRHTSRFSVDAQNNGVNIADLLDKPISEADCSSAADGNPFNQPCIIRTCEWSVHAGQGRCANSPYTNYYAAKTDPFKLDLVNPFYFYRLDEMRVPGGQPDPNNAAQVAQNETVTLYTLYYFQREADGSVTKQFLSSYAGQSNNIANLTRYHVPPVGTDHVNTDLHWVSPGAWNEIGRVPTRCSTQDWPKNNGGFKGAGTDGCVVNTVGDEDSLPPDGNAGIQDKNTYGRGFEIDMTQDVPGIIVDQVSRMKYIYLEVKTVEGASENGYEIWAGPPHSRYGFASNVNERNIQMSDKGSQFSTGGVSVYSVGIMPLNSMTGNRIDFPLVYVSPEYAGRTIEISLFDADSGTQYPICFYFDTIPNPDCQNGFDDSVNGYMAVYEAEANGRCRMDTADCNNKFTDPPFFVQVPDFTDDCEPTAPFVDRMENCNAFLGGRLMVSYDGGQHDTYQWLVNFPSVPYLKS